MNNLTLKTNLLLALFLFMASVTPLMAETSVSAGDMVITSKLMTFFKNIYVARGGVKAENKESVMTADRGIYDRDLEIVKAIDNVRVVQTDSVLTSDYLEAYIKEDRILARGNPKLVRIMERVTTDSETGDSSNKKSRIILTCNEVEAFQKENRFLAKGDVKLIEVAYRLGETEEEAKENEKKPISDLRCEILEMFSEENKAIARNNVVIYTETLRATGDKAIYLNNEDMMIIVGHAHAYQTSDDAGGNKQVSELFANKIIYYPSDERSIAVGDVKATVYPGSDSSKKSKDSKDKKKKKKKSDDDDDDVDDEESDDEDDE
jgi:lipopolysaccharide export system protein LptA